MGVWWWDGELTMLKEGAQKCLPSSQIRLRLGCVKVLRLRGQQMAATRNLRTSRQKRIPFQILIDSSAAAKAPGRGYDSSLLTAKVPF